MDSPDDTDRTVTRRSLLAGIATSSATAVAGCEFAPGGSTVENAPAGSPAGRAKQVGKYPRVEVGSLAGLEVGAVESFTYPLGGQQNFLTKLDQEAWKGVGTDSDVVAFSSMCTHMGCSIESEVQPENGTAGPCPCHYTSFDLSKGGLTVVGPATTDLPQVELEVEDGTVYATGVDGLVYGYRNNLLDGDILDSQEDGTESPSATDEDTADPQFGNWFDGVDNYDGVVDGTGQEEVTVSVGAGENGFRFDPPAYRVDAGTTVKWEWTGKGGGHNVVEIDGVFDSGEPARGADQHFEYSFEESGTYRYSCIPHEGAGMKGAIVVE